MRGGSKLKIPKVSLKSVESAMNKHTIGSLIGIILVVFIGGYLLNMFMGGGLFSRIEGNANMENKLTFYHMNGCGHCDKFNPIWDEFTTNYSGTPPITFEKIESADAPSSVKGYPTVILTRKDGSTSEFNADRTVGELQRFISDKLPAST
jgi:hypothetical protein